MLWWIITDSLIQLTVRVQQGAPELSYHSQYRLVSGWMDSDIGLSGLPVPYGLFGDDQLPPQARERLSDAVLCSSHDHLNTPVGAGEQQ